MFLFLAVDVSFIEVVPSTLHPKAESDVAMMQTGIYRDAMPGSPVPGKASKQEVGWLDMVPVGLTHMMRNILPESSFESKNAKTENEKIVRESRKFSGSNSSVASHKLRTVRNENVVSDGDGTKSAAIPFVDVVAESSAPSGSAKAAGLPIHSAALRGLAPQRGVAEAPVFIDVVSAVSPAAASVASHASGVSGVSRSLRMSAAEKIAVQLAGKKRETEPGDSVTESIDSGKAQADVNHMSSAGARAEADELDEKMKEQEEEEEDKEWNEDLKEAPGNRLEYILLLSCRRLSSPCKD